ncbi:Hypothetical predicted protein [Podarcis lilfordi]|uniref:Uncharacterized protein n=1 Tax=Podarcis lilfordi TaxID=74358 RepID=A0AA35KC78_9SAUR|nr:Hypothetical predicted protein [Podarcis lilfordi]
MLSAGTAVRLAPSCSEQPRPRRGPSPSRPTVRKTAGGDRFFCANAPCHGRHSPARGLWKAKGWSQTDRRSKPDLAHVEGPCRARRDCERPRPPPHRRRFHKRPRRQVQPETSEKKPEPAAPRLPTERAVLEPRNSEGRDLPALPPEGLTSCGVDLLGGIEREILPVRSESEKLPPAFRAGSAVCPVAHFPAPAFTH